VPAAPTAGGWGGTGAPLVVDERFAWGLAGILGGDFLVNLALGRRVRTRIRRVRLLLLSLVFGLVAYCACMVGLFPSSGFLCILPQTTAVLLLSGVAALIPGVAFLKAK